MVVSVIDIVKCDV